MKTWNEILALGGTYLAEKGVPDATLAAELLMARLLGCGRGFLAPHLAETPDDRHLEAMRRGMARLVKGEPIQYVLGEWDFRRLTLGCDRRALIPRPETEELVTRVLKFMTVAASSSRWRGNSPGRRIFSASTSRPTRLRSRRRTRCGANWRIA